MKNSELIAFVVKMLLIHRFLMEKGLASFLNNKRKWQRVPGKIVWFAEYVIENTHYQSEIRNNFVKALRTISREKEINETEIDNID